MCFFFNGEKIFSLPLDVFPPNWKDLSNALYEECSNLKVVNALVLKHEHVHDKFSPLTNTFHILCIINKTNFHYSLKGSAVAQW